MRWEITTKHKLQGEYAEIKREHAHKLRDRKLIYAAIRESC